MPTAPLDDTATIADFVRDPYALYRKYRAQSPIIRVSAVGRTMLTKAEDTKFAKENWQKFSSDDPNTPMRRAFQAHTLMRKDGAAHAHDRNAMMAAFGAKNIKDVWLPLYEKIAEDYVSRLPRGEAIDLFTELAAPVSARCLAHLIGLTHASDADLCRWSQTLIDGAGNFGWLEEPFEKSDTANDEINACIATAVEQLQSEPGVDAISAQLAASDPVTIETIQSNIKIVIGGGINEPRDALLTALYGLLINPDQKAAVMADPSLWVKTFEETIRWVAPIQVSSRVVMEDTQLRGIDLPKGETVMTIQASANHDEDLYEDPHLFNIFRENNRHQAFGNGPHFCMGTHIARRMIAEILLPKLFDRFPNMELADEVIFWGFGFRGPKSLPVILKW